MKNLKILSGLLVFLTLQSAFAGGWYTGADGEASSAEQFLSRIHPGQVVVLSEFHGFAAHHENQRQIIRKIGEAGMIPIVGMEHFDYTTQSAVNDYLRQDISEASFLEAVHWGAGLPFDNYREQVVSPLQFGGWTLALNLPRRVSGHIAQEGLASLTAEEQSLMPPNFTLGRESYYERFSADMKGHVAEDKIRNYFAAQSAWDETMAWKAAEFMKDREPVVLVIIVGDFHVAYQDGLVARLKARGLTDVLTLSQIDTTEMTDEERAATLQPDSEYGVRADFIFDAK